MIRQNFVVAYVKLIIRHNEGISRLTKLIHHQLEIIDELFDGIVESHHNESDGQQ